MYLTKRMVCIFWIVNILVGIYLIFTSKPNEGFIYIWLSAVGLWREWSNHPPKPELEFNPNFFKQMGDIQK